ncbi:MAG: DUF1929 domain-containing protein, partial [Phycisphaerae bacterium]|nr:DUF1929 domain-containing protein [Phycisphaerae bacterium]
PISRVTLIKTGAVTHSFNMDQRFTELPYSVSGNLLDVSLPTRASDLPPGYYYLFAFNNDGVPSQAHILRIYIDPSPDLSVNYTPTIGGSGGSSFILECNYDEILVGVHGKYGSVINQIGPRCVKMDQFGQWNGSPRNGPLTGTTTSGTSFSKTCPTNYAVSGFQGRAGSVVDQLDIQCRALTSTGGLTGIDQFLGPIGGSGGTAAGPFSCGTENPAYALYGRSSGLLDSFGMQCRQGFITPISVNSDPVIVNPGDQSSTIDEAVDLQLNASDGNGDPLTFSVIGLPPGLQLNSASGRITGSPTETGSFDVQATASDGSSSDSTTFNWVISPAAGLQVEPMFGQVAQEVDTVVEYSATATGGQNIVYKWDFGDGTPETTYSSSATVSHIFTQPGIYYVTLTVNDDAGIPNIQTFVQGVHLPHTAMRPRHSTNIL